MPAASPDLGGADRTDHRKKRREGIGWDTGGVKCFLLGVALSQIKYEIPQMPAKQM